jgi:hypothetical protein
VATRKKITDLTLLNSLLDAGKSRLSQSELKAFSSMLEGLEGGNFVNLSKGQREWVEKKYYDLGMDRAYLNRAPSIRKPILKSKALVPIWEQPKQLRPPGR